MTGYRTPAGREIRLGRAQRRELETAAAEPQRRAAGNPMMRTLATYGFVSARPHYSARLGRNTTDLVHSVTPEGERYLREGRDRA